MNPVLQKLRGRDRRSIGNSNRIVADVLAPPSLFPLLFVGMMSEDPLVRMRAADAVEKITRHRPELLQQFKSKIINEVSRVPQQEVRWHVAQLFSRLDLTPRERRIVYGILLEFLKDSSKIVRTFSMQALADIAQHDDSLRRGIVPLLKRLTKTGSPAMKSRGTKLIAALTATGRQHTLVRSRRRKVVDRNT